MSTPARPADRPARAPGRLRRALVASALAIGVLVALYAAAGFWGVPRLVEKELPPWLAQRYGLHLSLGDVRFDPFSFAAEAGGLALRAPDGALLLQADRVAVDFAPTGLLHKLWRFETVELTGLQVNLALSKDGTLDWVELAHRLAPPSTTPDAASPRVVVDRLALVRAGLRFTDLRGATPATATIAPIDASITGLSTLAGARASHTLTAALPDAATLRSQGDLVLQPSLAANGRLALTGLQAATVVPFLRSALRIDRLQGRADLLAGYAYGAAAGLRLDGVDLRIADLLLAATGVEAPLVEMKRLEAVGGSVDPAAHTVAFERLTLAQGSASASVDADGRIGWSRLVPPAAAASAAAAAPGPGWRVSVAAVALEKVALDYADRQRQPPLAARVGSVDATLRLTATTGAQPDVTATDLALQAHAITLPAAAAGGAALRLDGISVEGGSLRLAARQVAAKTVAIEGGSASIAREADGSIDWVRRFAPATAAGTSAAVAGAGAWHYAIGRADVGGIDLALSDRSTTPAFGYGVRIASASARHLANDAGTPVDFDARLVAQAGGALHAHGSVAADGSDLEGRVELDRLALGPFEPMVRRSTGFSATGGPLTLSADLRNAGGFSVDHLSADLPAVSVRPAAGGRPLFSAATLQVRGGRVALASRQVVVGRLALAQGAVRARLGRDGRLDALGAAPRTAAAAPSAAASAAPWNVRIDALAVNGMAAHYADASRPTPLRLDIDRIDVETALQVTAGGDRPPQVAAHGLQAQVQAASLVLGDRRPPALTLASAALKDGSLDLAGKRFGATELSLVGGSTRIVRDAAGQVDLLASLGTAPAATPAPAGAGWAYAVDTARLQGFGISVEDRSLGAPLALAGRLDATARNVASQGRTAFDARFAFADGKGSVTTTGTAAPASGELQAHVLADAVALAPLQPLLARYTTLALQSGRVQTDLQLTAGAGGLRASGGFGVDALALNEAGSGANVLSFDRLTGQRLDFSAADHRLTIGDVALSRPATKIAIAKDHGVNLEQLLKRRDAGAPAPAASAASAPALDVTVQRIGVSGGSVDFSDQSLILPFATKVTGIVATIANVSSAADRRADVQASGSIQEYGSASVEGSVVPTSPRTFTDLQVKFNNVRLAPFSPYTATFAGCKVESGKLWLDLDYKIDQGELKGSNDVRLNDFTLGERVASPTAIDLPLDLAVSLLTDSKGEIHLSVPVRGDLADPKFKVGDAIAQAVGNILTRIVTAPFRLIGRLFGGGKDALASIDFAPGSSVLAPEQREKLDALIRALRDRPLLRLVVGAPYAESADTLALQQAQTRRQLAARLGSGDTTLALVAFDDDATRRALRALAPPASSAAPAEDRAGYEAMFDRIAKAQRLDTGALQVLASQRAATIAAYLTGQGIDRGRVQTGQVQAVKAGDAGTVDAALSVAAATGAR